MLRSIEKKDLPTLAEFYVEFGGTVANVEKMEQNLEKIATMPDYHLLGYFEEEQLLGSIIAIVCPDFCGECRPFLIVENVIVSEQSRGKGVGKKLMAAVEQIAAKHDCFMIEFVSSGYRLDAHRFYEGCGYNEDVRGFRKFL